MPLHLAPSMPLITLFQNSWNLLYEATSVSIQKQKKRKVTFLFLTLVYTRYQPSATRLNWITFRAGSTLFR